MKKIQIVDALRTVQKRFISYLSIVFIIMMGTGGFLMTQYTGLAIENCGRDFYNAQEMKDFELISSIGISESDLEALRSVEGVKNTEGVIVLDGVMNHGSTAQDVKLLSITKEVSIPKLVEGKAPENRGECMVASDTAKALDVHVGDRVSILTDTIYQVYPLLEKEFTVTGIMLHPDYVRSGFTMTVVLPFAAFDLNAMEHRYSHAFVTAENCDRKHMFSASYTASIAPVKQNLEAKLDTLRDGSFEEAKRLANARIDAQLEEGMKMLAEAEQKIADGEAELEAKLAEGRAQIADARAKLNWARQQLESGEALLRNAEAFLSAIHQLRNLMKDLSPREMREFIQTVTGWMDAYEAADDYAKPEYQRMLQAYVRAPENSDKVFIIREMTGMDLVQCSDNPASYSSAKEVLRQASAVLMLMEAEDHGFSLQEVLTTADQLTIKLEAIQNAKDYESRQRARAELARMLEEPRIQEQLVFMNDYLGISPDGLYLIAYGEGEIDGETLKLLRELINAAKRIRNSILNAEAMVARGRAELAMRWSQYYEGLRLVNEMERLMKEKEAEARAQIAEARAQLEEKKKEAEEQLAKARAEVDGLTDVWIIQERSFNTGFSDVSSNTKAAYKVGYAMGGLFILVSAMVCFSTLVIIVDEEKKLVGTSKAFGLTNTEILEKYLFFGGTSALAGGILGVLMAIGISLYVEAMLRNVQMYIFPISGIHIVWPVTIILTLGYVVLCGLVTVFACQGLLRSTAYQLISGVSAARKKKQVKKSSRSRGSLYSRLVVRNMINERERVLISILIISVGCLIVGVGISLKLAFEGMIDRQPKEVTLYDYRVSLTRDVTEENRKEVEEKMRQAGIDFMPAVYQPCLFDNDGHLDALILIAADSEEIGSYFSLKDPRTKEIQSLPETGVLVQNRMHESYDIKAGDTLKLYDSRLRLSQAGVAGEFLNYQGRMGFISLKGYEEIFHQKPESNCYYVRLNGYDPSTFPDLLFSVSDGFSPETVNYFLSYLRGTIMIYDIIVAISIFIAVVMSFIILTNLASIYINRKKKELIVMRINGFTIGETIRYLSKEAIVTGVIGLLSGVVIGIVVTPYLIRILEPADAMFVRSTHWPAWIIAVLTEGAFDLIINVFVFRRVRTLNFHDIL